MTPNKFPDVLVYAGDTTVFGTYTFQTGNTPINMVSAGWTNWSAQWRSKDGSLTLDLQVDTTDAATGQIVVRATHLQSREMGGPGTWDLQATKTSTYDTPYVQTFGYGVTKYREDVTDSDE